MNYYCPLKMEGGNSSKLHFSPLFGGGKLHFFQNWMQSLRLSNLQNEQKSMQFSSFWFGYQLRPHLVASGKVRLYM